MARAALARQESATLGLRSGVLPLAAGFGLDVATPCHHDGVMYDLTRTLRELEITQTELATTMEVPPNSIAQWCTGNRTPSLQNAMAITDALGITLDELVGHPSTNGAEMSPAYHDGYDVGYRGSANPNKHGTEEWGAWIRGNRLGRQARKESQLPR